MSSDKKLQEKTSEALKKVGVGAATVVDAVTTPPKTNKHAATTKNTWQNIKDLVGKVKSGDEWSPFKERVGRVRNTPSERARGNDISASYGASGKLTLTVANYVFNDDALRILDAVDSSDKKQLDPNSAALRINFSSDTLIDVKALLNNKEAMKGYEKLVGLREKLAELGGTISVNRSNDGFGRVLKVTLDTENKTEAQIQKEIEAVFECIGIKNSTLAKSFAKEMVHKRTLESSEAGKQVSNVKTKPARSGGPGSEAPRPSSQVAQEGYSQDSGVDSTAQHSVDSGKSEAGDDMVLGSSAATTPGVSPGDIVPESFDLAKSVGSYARLQIGGRADTKAAAGLQTRFLERCGSGVAAGASKVSDAGIHLDDALLRGASMGLDGVTQDGLQQSGAATSFTPTSAPGQAAASARAVSTGRDA
ncbi:hypothetical protein ACIS_00889 [Anaplasma centrale str. Israel]|uniref:Uncharacterized protein n=1 Tax=Anaplasma centrale (strain Israel) TaxID=574556 RepID=D1ASF9_ANACI|nr:hypothetical protein [Anaplasma centrale]ACZ49412.1 hypothetical protein ACIS_00889 [Anaplasma centrale str. Israel]